MASRLIEQINKVRQDIKYHFDYVFKEPLENKPLLEGIIKCLEVPFGEDEVKEDVWSNARDKSPGINGFNFYFFKESWDILKDSIINFLNEFYSNTRLQKVVTYSKI